MAMSQGTSTFLACFGGFWLVWAAVVLLCCLCSVLQRRLKRLKEERHREQCLRTVEAESLTCPAQSHVHSHTNTAPLTATSRENVQVCPLQATPSTAPPPHVPLPLPQANWVTMPTDTDVFGNPPCYEEAVLMEDPPPPYSEVLADPRGGTYLKPTVLRPAAPAVPVCSPYPLPFHCSLPGPSFVPAPCSNPAPCHAPTPCPNPAPLYPIYSDSKALPTIPDRGYSSLIRLPSSQRWDSLGHLLSNMDLNPDHLTPPSVRSLHAAGAMATMPRRDVRAKRALRVPTGYSSLQGRTHTGGHRPLHRVRGLDPNCGLPTAFPLLGRSTAV